MKNQRQRELSHWETHVCWQQNCLWLGSTAELGGGGRDVLHLWKMCSRKEVFKEESKTHRTTESSGPGQPRGRAKLPWDGPVDTTQLPS